MRTVLPSDIAEMNRLYSELHTYAAVARQVGFSPATVKKYIDPNYQMVDTTSIIHFNRPLPPINTHKFRGKNWGTMCVLTDNEVQNLRDLWKEIEV